LKKVIYKRKIKQQGKAYKKDEIIESLKPYFLLGYNRAKSCMFIGFDTSTLCKWEEKDHELSIKIDSWINYINSKARANITESIEKDKDKEDSKWWLTKQDKDFNEKITNLNVDVNEASDDITKALDELIGSKEISK
jgi:hypothetical protein